MRSERRRSQRVVQASLRAAIDADRRVYLRDAIVKLGAKFFRVVVRQCGGQALVPFLPRNDRPVYCSSCFDKVRARA